ncbi:MAG TPA: DUF5684 domain-containing protein [Candidatus Saccharimonadales bacterium]|jgi:hypothetical protein|nr:DUF5684 domain-containing protein [Candidatus Saccharimonadales bacterium]
MKKQATFISRFGWLLTAGAVLAGTGTAFAQYEESKVPAAFLGGFLVVALIFAALGYIYMALSLQTIATKTNTENAWLAWIPIVNLILMLNIAKKPIWWFILMLIPLVNIVVIIIVWMGIAEARNKPNWWGILMIVPLVGIIVPGYLAWSD